MKRKLLAALLAVCLVVAALPVGASAAATENCPGECQHAAAIGGTHYNTLAEALNAAEDGDTVTLLQDASTEPVTIDKGITLDLGGKTLSLVQDSTTNAVGLAFTNQGENVLKNGILYDGRSDGNTSAGFIAVRLTGGGTLTTEDVEIQSYQPDSDKNYNYLLRADGKTGALVLKSGTVLKELERTTTQSEITHGTVGVAVFGGYATQTTEFEETIDVTVEDGVTIQTMGFAISGNGSDRNGTNITINGGDITSTGAQAIYHPQYGTLTVNGGNITGTTGIEMRSGVLHVLEDATIVGTAVPTDVDANGNGSTTVGAGVAIAQHTTKLPINVTITGGTIQGYTGLYESNPQSNPEDAIEKIKISIAGGNFSAINGGINAVFSQDCKGFISGGYFTSDPTPYLEEGKVAVPSTEPGYSYTVAQKEEAAAEVVVAAPNVPEVDTSGMTQDEITLAESVKEALTSTDDGDTAPGIDESALSAAANAVANDNKLTGTDDEVTQALANAGVTTEGETVTIVIQPYLEIAVKDVSVAGDPGSETKAITLEITPMYRTVATTANLDGDDDIVLEAGDGGEENTVNAAQIGQPQELKVDTTVEVTIPLPADFATDEQPLYIKHEKNGGRTYYYTGTVAENVLTFTNPHGFSSFTVSATNEAVAEIDGVGYATLQEAVNDVASGGTIKILKDGTYQVSGNKSFVVQNASGVTDVTIEAAPGYTLTNDGTTYTVSAVISGGGGSAEPEEPQLPFEDVDGNDWWYEAVAYVYEQEIMAGTSENTFAPTLELDRAQAVQLFYNLEGQPAATEEPSFSDVAGDHWAIAAIAWGDETGVVAGYDDGTFKPDVLVSRQEFAQMLYNYAKYKGADLTAAGDLTRFPDGEEVSAWARTAMAWANGKGLVNGNEDGTLAPLGTTNRAQAASIMAKYDQLIGK